MLLAGGWMVNEIVNSWSSQASDCWENLASNGNHWWWAITVTQFLLSNKLRTNKQTKKQACKEQPQKHLEGSSEKQRNSDSDRSIGLKNVTLQLSHFDYSIGFQEITSPPAALAQRPPFFVVPAGTTLETAGAREPRPDAATWQAFWDADAIDSLSGFIMVYHGQSGFLMVNHGWCSHSWSWWMIWNRKEQILKDCCCNGAAHTKCIRGGPLLPFETSSNAWMIAVTWWLYLDHHIISSIHRSWPLIKSTSNG